MNTISNSKNCFISYLHDIECHVQDTLYHIGRDHKNCLFDIFNLNTVYKLQAM